MQSVFRASFGRFLTLVSFLCVFLLFSCDKSDDSSEADETSSRTVLVYMVAENSLDASGYNFAVKDINEMLRGRSSMSDNDRLVIYYDGQSVPLLYVVDRKTKASVAEDLKGIEIFSGDVNSCDPEVLDDVVSYTMEHYQADSYGIIFWSHASGWVMQDHQNVKYRNAHMNFSFGVDNGKNSGSNMGREMNISEMASVLGRFPKFDFIMFDACFMQSVEVCHELKSCCNYIIGSPAEIPGPGAPYDKIMSPMFSDKLSVEGIVDAYYSYYNQSSQYGAVLSAVDCSQLDQLASTTSFYLSKYGQSFNDVDYSSVQNYFIYDSWNYMKDGMPDCYDINSLMKHLLSSEDYQSWLPSLYQSVPYRKSTSTWYTAFINGFLPVNLDEYGGISMFLPLDKYVGEKFLSDYETTSWAKTVLYN